MTRVEDTIVVPAPIREVFQYASDWQTWEHWFDGVSRFRPTSEITRGDGASYSYTARVFGIPSSVETEIRDFVEDKGWKGTARKGMAHTTTWAFESIGERTRVTCALEFHVSAPVFGALLDSFLRYRWRQILDASLKNLRHHFQSPVPLRVEP